MPMLKFLKRFNPFRVYYRIVETDRAFPFKVYKHFLFERAFIDSFNTIEGAKEAIMLDKTKNKRIVVWEE